MGTQSTSDCSRQVDSAFSFFTAPDLFTLTVECIAKKLRKFQPHFSTHNKYLVYVMLPESLRVYWPAYKCLLTFLIVIIVEQCSLLTLLSLLKYDIYYPKMKSAVQRSGLGS